MSLIKLHKDAAQFTDVEEALEIESLEAFNAIEVFDIAVWGPMPFGEAQDPIFDQFIYLPNQMVFNQEGQVYVVQGELARTIAKLVDPEREGDPFVTIC